MNRKVDVQRRNGFALPFVNAGTVKVGTLVPVLCKKVVPGDIVTDNISYNIELPPMASNFKGRVDICFESFFVPNRILYGGWRDYVLFNGGIAGSFKPAGVPQTWYPKLVYSTSRDVSYRGNGKLSDYLGLPTSPSEDMFVDTLRFMAYHRIYNDWYRNKQVQQQLFIPRGNNVSITAGNLPYSSILSSSDQYVNGDDGTSPFIFNDGVDIWSLRQRNWSNDYFTDSFLTQNGAQNTFNVEISDDGYFSVQQFRTANALTRFSERNNLANGDYKTSIFVNYGVTPSDALCEQAVFVRQIRKPLITKSVFATSNVGSGVGESPYTDMVGGRAGFSDCVDSGLLFDNFQVKEHGYIMVIMSIVPYANYAQYVPREAIVRNSAFSDNFMIPQLAQVGNQEIYNYELFSETDAPYVPFGYTERYAEYKNFVNEIHGLLRYDGDMSYYAVQRAFGNQPSLNSSFLEIPTTALDNVTAISTWLTQFGAVYEVFHDCKMVRPLPEYSTPTLCDHILDSKWVSVHDSQIH